MGVKKFWGEHSPVGRWEGHIIPCCRCCPFRLEMIDIVLAITSGGRTRRKSRRRPTLAHAHWRCREAAIWQRSVTASYEWHERTNQSSDGLTGAGVRTYARRCLVFYLNCISKASRRTASATHEYMQHVTKLAAVLWHFYLHLTVETT